MNKRHIFITIGILLFIVSFLTVYFTIFEYLVSYGFGFLIGFTCALFLLKTVDSGDNTVNPLSEPRLYSYEEFVGMSDNNLYDLFHSEYLNANFDEQIDGAIYSSDARKKYYLEHIYRFSSMLQNMFNANKNK